MRANKNILFCMSVYSGIIGAFNSETRQVTKNKTFWFILNWDHISVLERQHLNSFDLLPASGWVAEIEVCQSVQRKIEIVSIQATSVNTV
jgi:hypothetical protein